MYVLSADVVKNFISWQTLRICMQMTAETIATVIKADQKPAEEAIIETPPMDRKAYPASRSASVPVPSDADR